MKSTHPRILLIAGHNRGNYLTFPFVRRDPGKVLLDDHGREYDNEHWMAERAVIQAKHLLSVQFPDLDVEICPFNINLKQKVKYVNEHYERGDFVFEVHYNAAVPQAHGSEIYYLYKDKRSYYMAKRMASLVAKKMNMRNRGAKKDDTTRHGRLAIVRDVVARSYLLELGFMTNYHDYIKAQAYSAEAIVRAVKYAILFRKRKK